MIFHIPTTTELVSTDVAYQVPLYDANATYNDGDEVRQGDDIYTVYNKYDDIPYPLYQDYMFYFQNNPSIIDGQAYQKKHDNIGQGCWENIAELVTLPVTALRYDYYDGSDDFSITVNSGQGNGTCQDDVHYQFTVDGINQDGSKNLHVVITNLADSSTVADYHIPLYDKPIPSIYAMFVLHDGKVYKVKGYKKADVVSTFIEDNTWEQMPHNYYTSHSYALEYLRQSVKKVPFDTKQYTTSKVNSSQSWVVKAPRTYLSVNREKVTSVMLGRVVGTNLHIDFLDFNGNTISSLDIDLTVNSIPFDMTNYTNIEPSTHIIYIPQDVYQDVHQMSITISDNNLRDTEIGFISFAKYIDVGATNLEFTHDIKNFDKNKVSEISGYIDHIKGQRVVQHKGSFDILLTDYDKMLMINKRFTQELIAIDGSDTTSNEASDSQNRFQSTKLIGRVKRLGMQTRTKQNKLDDTQTITFEFEEVV